MQEEKWQIKKKNGYIKIHIAVDIKNKKILAFLEVTDDDEKVQTMKESMSKLIGHILKNSNNIKFKSVLCDGSYYSNENFEYLQNKRIRLTAIKVRKNSIV
jgi:hypothetical protein